MGALAGILLAGGASRRYGANKLLTAIVDGVPLGLRSAANLAAALADVWVVVPAAAPDVRRLFERDYRVTVCPDAHEGIARSIAHGVGASADADGWVIALADMPYVRPETIRAVAAAVSHPAAIVRPCHGGRGGHPVGFGSAYGAELRALRGDVGAAPVIERHRDALVSLAVDDPGVLFDIDRPDDLARDVADTSRDRGAAS